jgi:ATP-binding cassette subfamily F protein uup
MGGPNVLILDEPTNDFDVETLAALEDLLDSFAGTLLVVSHDRYFLERTCDLFVGVMGDGSVRNLPRGIEQYLELRQGQSASHFSTESGSGESKASVATLSTAMRRDLSKDLSKAERAIERLDKQISALHADMEQASTDFVRVSDLDAQLRPLVAEKETLENKWLEISDQLAK